ncbi:MAG: hypothetical protein G01um101448_534 [Parcubacteria group bacterium Gr01-1014_48]|nr:MAG: hypothetical protein Greene041614_634 [Parcubacteria group bacterium Greene0416_14]TSC73800.1 MAG: hypothetical protein G01um101448_534 [Parcubacteria group bacterium Gr01-1014_48]TSD01082.1 MAG: hypothetical protein Greene101415_485 [Parcubacteria group bacterium Greene1014_15]TSD08055.1 MAG: hypothetical protein Greene07144_448 [Parcubacteria group bacterium Greene0714_4]
MVTREQKILLLLRIGLVFSLFYAALSSLIDPQSWIGYFPHFVRSLAPSELMLTAGFSFVQLVIGGWILYGKNIFVPSILATAMLFCIVIFNMSQMAVVFRDISILFMALALTIANQKRYREEVPQSS